MGLVFLIGFRRPAAALLPLAKVGICLVLVFGAMGWLGVPVYLTTAVLPVLLLAVGTAAELDVSFALRGTPPPVFRAPGATERALPFK